MTAYKELTVSFTPAELATLVTVLADELRLWQKLAARAKQDQAARVAFQDRVDKCDALMRKIDTARAPDRDQLELNGLSAALEKTAVAR